MTMRERKSKFKNYQDFSYNLNWKTTGPPSRLFSEGIIVNPPAGLAEVMNKFFTNKVRQLRQGIPANVSDPLKTLKETMSERTCEFSFKSVDTDKVLTKIRSLKNSKSTGLDKIDTYTIKLVASDILPALTHVINLSSAWKKSKVVPLLKNAAKRSRQHAGKNTGNMPSGVCASSMNKSLAPLQYKCKVLH